MTTQLPASQSNALTLAQEQYDYLLLDGSGSMTGIWWDMLANIDRYVASLKATGTNSHLHLSIFTSPKENIDMVARDCPIADWKSVVEDAPGSHFQLTPLYDAIEVMAGKLHKINPKRCAVTIFTDGDESRSQICDKVRARTLLDWMRAKGWSVTFVGCEFNNAGLAAQLGASASSAIGVQQRLMGEAVSELARKRAAYGKTGAPVHWSEAEQKQFGGYLAAPSK